MSLISIRFIDLLQKELQIHVRVGFVSLQRKMLVTSLSLPRFSLSVRPSDMENCPCVSAHRSEASVLACNTFTCIKTGLIELSQSFPMAFRAGCSLCDPLDEVNQYRLTRGIL